MDVKHSSTFSIEENALQDKGAGVVVFPEGLKITDNSEQRNGTKYDIDSMDIKEYKGILTANHSMDIQEIIGKVSNIKKQNNAVTIGKIQFAVDENALALYAYNMLKAGFLTDFSIETIGPYPEDDGTYRNSKLIGLSAVVVGNNRSARINEIETVTINSIQEAKDKGLDTSKLQEQSISVINFTPLKNMVEEEEKVETVDNSSVIAEAVKSALEPVINKMAELEQKVFDAKAQEPTFVVANKVSSMKGMGYKEVHAKQIQSAWDFLKAGNYEASKTLSDLNKMNLERLQEAGVVSNSVTIADFGNFVISPELLSDIEGFRSDYAGLTNRLNFQETLSLQMAWLKRSGYINMTGVEICDDGENGNLKPISEYGAEIKTSNLEELAAVTPICNAATRFLAVDLLSDVSAGYRLDYDRKKAQLFIARLQQAVNTTGNVVPYATTSDVNSLKSFISTWSTMAEEIPNGTFIFNYRTHGELIQRAVGAGISGPLAGIFTTGEMPTILGRPYIVVPNDLLPDLNTATTKLFTVNGVAVTINRAVFYADLSTFTGRVSGGLQYNISADAAYEENGTVKSAYQRNEIVLRGSFFRGGAIRDDDKVVAMGAPGVS